MLKHLPGKIMIADLLTKAVARPIFLELTRLIAEYAATGVVIERSSFLASVRLGGRGCLRALLHSPRLHPLGCLAFPALHATVVFVSAFGSISVFLV